MRAPSGVAAPPMDARRAAALLETITGARVVVLGDVMLDHYLEGRVERMSPEAPVPVLRVEREETRLGGAANVAANLAALGARCTLLGCSGTDQARSRLLAGLDRLGIDPEGIVACPDRPTTTKTRLVARSQQIVRFDRECDRSVPGATEEALLRALGPALDGAHALALQDYNKGTLTRRIIREALREAAARGLPVVVDPKHEHFFDFRGATVFKPNLRETSQAFDEPVELTGPWLRAARARLGAEHLLLTLGARGMVLQGTRGAPLRLAATARRADDPSGAGDTVTAVMTAVLAAGSPPEEGAVLANLAAGIQVGKSGVAAVSAEELLREVEGAHVSANGASSTSGSPARPMPGGTPEHPDHLREESIAR